MPELPLYGTEPRVQVQEPPRPVAGGRAARPQLRRDRPAGVLGVRRPGGRRLRQVHREGAGRSPTSCSPGSSSAASGTSPARVSRIGKKVDWDADVLEELMRAAGRGRRPQGQFLWNNKQVVPVYVPEQHEPWAAVQTKKLDAVYLHLIGPEGPLHAGADHRPGLRSRAGRPAARAST